MATIRFSKKSSINPWNVCIRRKGFPTITKSFKTEEEARSFAKQTEEGLESLGSAQSLPKVPLKVWIDRWYKEIGPTRKYLRKEMRYINFWDKVLGNEIAIYISPIKIEFLADEVCNQIGRHGTKLSDETRRKYLLYLSSLYTTAIKTWKWATVNPLASVNMKKKEEDRKIKLKENIETFNNFRIRFSDLVKAMMVGRGLTHRGAAKKCSMTLNSFQGTIDTKANPTLQTISKVCEGFGLKISIEEID